MHWRKLADVNITQWTSIWSVWLKGGLSGKADTCSERPGWPVLWLRALNCEEVQIGGDASEDWLSCVGNLVLAGVCWVTGAWLLSFPGLLKHFQKKICSLKDYFPLVVIVRMCADTCWEVDWSQTNWSDECCEMKGSHLHSKKQLISDLDRHYSNCFHKRMQCYIIISWNYSFQKCISHKYGHNDETHPAVQLCEVELFWWMILGLRCQTLWTELHTLAPLDTSV